MNLLTTLFAAIAIGQSPTPLKDLGQLGKMILPGAIYSAPDIGSHVHHNAKSQDYIVLVPTDQKGWWRVLLANGKYGFVQANSVEALEYRVQVTKSLKSNASDWAFSMIGENPNVTTSGEFVQMMFAKTGKKLPRQISSQMKIGKPIKQLEELEKGDRLYFWSDQSEKINDVGIYLGNGHFTFLNAKTRTVEMKNLASDGWLDRLVASRR